MLQALRDSEALGEPDVLNVPLALRDAEVDAETLALGDGEAELESESCGKAKGSNNNSCRVCILDNTRSWIVREPVPVCQRKRGGGDLSCHWDWH